MIDGNATVTKRASPIPPGAAAVGLGLVSASVTTYGFLALTARALGPERYAPISVLWSIVFLVVPATFIPLEQETSRRISARLATGVGFVSVVRSSRVVAVAMVGIAVAVVAGTAPVAIPELFSDQTLVVVALACATAAFAVNHLTRSLLAGTGRFGRYGWCVALDSFARLAMAATLAIAGVDTAGPYAFAVAIAPIIPAIALFPRSRGRRDGHWHAGSGIEKTPDTPADIARNVAPLVSGQFFAQVLVNGGAPIVALLATDAEQAVASRFLATLLIARVPLFFFMAIQSSLMPRLASLHAVGDVEGFARQVRVLLVGVGALAVASTLGALVVGVPVVELLFGDEYSLGRRDLTMLAAASAIYMLGVVAAQAVIALAGHTRVTAAWFAGVVAFGVGVAAADDLLWRVEIGLLAGMITAVASLLTVLRSMRMSWATSV